MEKQLLPVVLEKSFSEKFRNFARGKDGGYLHPFRKISFRTCVINLSF